MKRKVTVVGGAGNVGATVARQIAEKGLADVVIIDIAESKAAGIGLDRKVLADLAVTDENAFKSIVDQAKSALEDKSKSKKKAA